MISPLEDQLAAGMRDVAAGFHVDRDLVAGARDDLRKRTTRRRALVSAATAAVVVVAGLGFAVAGREESPQLTNVAWVTEQVGTALAADSRMIQHTTTRHWGVEGESTEEGWYDPTTGDKVEVDGMGPGIDLGFNLREPEDQRWITFVDRKEQRWWKTRGQQAVWAPPSTPEEIRAELKAGRGLEIVGEEKVNGVSTLHLRMPLKPLTTEPLENVTYDLWAEEESFRLVRTLFTGHFPDSVPSAGPTYTQDDYEWLERTPETLARVRLSPPPGWPSQGPSAGEVVPAPSN